MTDPHLGPVVPPTPPQPNSGQGHTPAEPFAPPPAYGHPDYQDIPVEVTGPEAFEDKTWQDVKEVRAEEKDSGYAPGEAPNVEYEQHDGPAVIQTHSTAESGLSKCPKCGATEISLSVDSGMLRCHFCRFEWQEESAVDVFRLHSPISELQGITIGSGSAAIVPDVSEVMSFKCSACGAEVVVDTAHAMQSRCHWCRNTLSVNQQVPNGAVPDAVLPFSLPKQVAIEKISAFVKQRSFFAHRKFKAEFNAENVIGVYLPYMIVDVNAKLYLAGVGEHQTRRYTVGSEKNQRTVYDADVYQVQREFDYYVDDLTLESSSDKLDVNVTQNTNNIVNSVLPFDTENIVRFNANYLAGFSSQRRDTDVDGMMDLVLKQTQDIGRYQAKSTIRFYDRGVRWEQERFDPVGQRWISAYLPIWLYSYYEKKSGGKELLHYIAVNGRTGETMGSIPLNMPKLWVATGIAQVLGTITTFILALGF